MAKLIMFAGGIGSGKAYQMNKFIAEKKETGHSIAVLSFADPIKQFVKEITGYDKNGNYVSTRKDISFETFKDKARKFLENSDMDNVSSVWDSKTDLILSDIFDLITELSNITNNSNKIKELLRKIMQLVGTDFAHQFKKDIWPNYQFNKFVKISQYFDYVIIDDWRFMFEFITAQIRFQKYTEVIPYYVSTSFETRAKRRKISVEELLEQSQHASERESNEVILPFMNLHYPDNIIDGENE